MKYKILHADDEENLRKMLRIILKNEFEELDVESFENGSSLEERLKGNIEGVKLVLTDNTMPGIKGSEIIKSYAKKPEFAQLPFILFYAGDPSLGKELVREHGAFAYSMKGTDIQDLIKKIREALGYSESIR